MFAKIFLIFFLILNFVSIAQSAKELVNHSLRYYNSRDYESAVRFAQKTLTVEPENQRALKILGCSAMELNQFEKAITAFESMIEMNVADISSIILLGKAYIKYGFETSGNEFGNIEDGNAINQRNKLIASTKLYFEKAENVFNLACELAPDNAEAVYWLGFSSELLLKNDKAQELYKKSSQLGFKEADEKLKKNKK